MADKKITELPNINGTDLVDADEFVVVDISADETKAITLAELKTAFDAGTGFVRVTGDTMTGVLKMPNGSNSAPSISNTGDTNTGMFFGAAETVSFTSDGTKRLDINTSGIGVTGNIAVTGTVDGRDVSADGVLATNALPKSGGTISSNLVVSGNLTTAAWYTGVGSQGILNTNTNDFVIKSQSNDTHIYMANDGAVTLNYDNGTRIATTSTGVAITGTTTSSGQVKVTGSSTSAVAFSVGDTNTGFYNTGSNSIGLSINGTNKLTINNSGQLITTPAAIFNGGFSTKATGTIKHTDSVDNISLSPTSSGGVLNVRNSSGTAVITLDGRTSNVGIGTAPSAPLTVAANGSGNNLQLTGRSSDGFAFLQYRNNANSATNGEIGVSNAKNMQIYTNGQERIRILAAGAVGFGTENPSADAIVTISNDGAQGIELRANSDRVEYMNYNRSANAYMPVRNNGLSFEWYLQNAPKMILNSSGHLGINCTAASSTFLDVKGKMTLRRNVVAGHASTGNWTFNISHESSAVYGTLYLTSGVSTGEIDLMGSKFRFTKAGELLIGKTVTSLGTAGVRITPSGISATRANGSMMTLNLTGNDAEVIGFYKNTGYIANIGVSGSDNLYISGTVANHCGITLGTNQLLPTVVSSIANGTVDLGGNGGRWKQLFATNSTISTSDRNEKQDIAALTSTEMLVAKRISALFKTFRWKDKVATEGDDARTHTGTIAQDVQSAFSAEGLDAGDYSLFTSGSWWEHDVEVAAVEADDTAEPAIEAADAYTRTDTHTIESEAPEGSIKKTRLGIRYSELLSFLAAYNEQRFAAIETRLTVLEG